MIADDSQFAKLANSICPQKLIYLIIIVIIFTTTATQQLTTTTPQPFYGPFSATTQVSRCQKRTCELYGARDD